MISLPRRTLLLVLIVAIAGCSGVFVPDGSDESREQRFRLVVQNDVSSTQSVGMTLTNESGQTIFNETKTLQPGGGWVVSTFNVSSLNTPVRITAHLPNQNITQELSLIRSTERGARLYTVTNDHFNIYECNENVTCWQQK